MDKHLKFEGIEINGSIEDFIAKLERKGYVMDTPIFGTGFKMAALRGEYADYTGLCKVVVSTNSDEIVNNVMVQGEDYYSVDNVMDDFEFFKEKAEEYNIDYNDEEDDYFDEDDIDSFRDGSLHKHIYYKRESDGSGIMVSVGVDDEDDTFHVTMMLINGANSEGTEKELKMASKELDEAKERLAQIDSEHLIFSGVEMDGAIEDFMEELEAKGFRTDMEPNWVGEHELATMRGQFLGEPCNLLLTSNDIGDITLVFAKRKERKSFDVVKDEFYKLFNIYKQKYGEPDQLEETLLDMPDPISAIKNERGTLAAYFKVGTEGSSISILVTIEDESRFPHITLLYADGINQGINNTEDDYADLDEDFDVDDIDVDNYYDDI